MYDLKIGESFNYLLVITVYRNKLKQGTFRSTNGQEEYVTVSCSLRELKVKKNIIKHGRFVKQEQIRIGIKLIEIAREYKQWTVLTQKDLVIFKGERKGK